jgi:phage tail-like protein
MIRLDPLPAFNFYVTLIEDPDNPLDVAKAAAGLVLGGFSECTGLESEIQTEDYLAGGMNDRVLRFPTRASYSPITLTRGVGFSESLYLWHEEFLKGEGKRRNGLIFLANELRVPIKCWTFEKGIPAKWVGPSLNATTSGTSIEKLEIIHEKLTLTMSPGKALDMVGSALGL